MTEAPILSIDQSSRTWQLVADFVNKRIAVLQESCCALEATPTQREQDAARIHELRTLLQAPKDAVALGRGQTNKPGATY